jgi:hypothetical protein
MLQQMNVEGGKISDQQTAQKEQAHRYCIPRNPDRRDAGRSQPSPYIRCGSTVIAEVDEKTSADNSRFDRQIEISVRNQRVRIT